MSPLKQADQLHDEVQKNPWTIDRVLSQIDRFYERNRRLEDPKKRQELAIKFHKFANRLVDAGFCESVADIPLLHARRQLDRGLALQQQYVD